MPSPCLPILHALSSSAIALVDPSGDAAARPQASLMDRLHVLDGYVAVFVAAFLVSLFATPLMRRLAISQGIIDRPSDPRKIHKIPVAYLGGVAVFLGIIAGIFASILGMRFGWIEHHTTEFLGPDGYPRGVPWSVLVGMFVIVLVGVIDDMTGISPRVKIGGQLFAAAALAYDTVGVRVAAGFVLPIAKGLGVPTTFLPGNIETVAFMIPGVNVQFDVIYWAGTAVIGLAVIGLCNAANLIDGLDGLLSGTTSISALGILFIALGLAVLDDGPRDSARLVLCLALIGACMGFLPHNFNPATIFLGDAGSLLIGFVMCVLILSLGDTGKTHLVAAGLIAFLLPILDTALAIVRRKMEGKSISAADDQHLHHQLKRAMGVKRAVLVLYAAAASFAMLAALLSLWRARMVYLLAVVLVAYIAVTAIKIARRRHIESQMLAREVGLAPSVPTPAAQPATPPASTGAATGA